MKNNKGMILLVVICTIFLAILLSNVILRIISSQSRLTHHQVSRIQAYYAGLGGVNYAYDKLRKGDWATPTSPVTYYLCRSLNDCIPNVTGNTLITEAGLPKSLQGVSITITPRGQGSCLQTPGEVPFCISATATYTYTP